VKILVVDDHHLIREGLRPLLEAVAHGEAVQVLEADSLARALQAADDHPDLDLALVDLRMPDVVDFEAVSRLRERQPALPVVVMSGDNEPGVVKAALEHGALGFIPKSSSSKVILGALRLVLAGGTYIPREAIEGGSMAPAPLPATAPGSNGGLDVTPRQMEVLRLMLAGKSNKAIGRELALAEGTVKNHVAAVLKALQVTTRTQAVIAAAKRGVKA
jgi:DNA-binding NarL/FixJ family response regulator